jgi:hypothetical protein
MAHVRTFQLGRHTNLSQRLLNELAAARLCLLKSECKVAYDQQLRDCLAPVAPGARETAAPTSTSVADRPNRFSPQTSNVPHVLEAHPPQPLPIAAAPVAAVLPLRAFPAAPIVAQEIPVAEESIATERWLVNERNKVAFYRLVTRSIWALVGVIPLFITGYVALSHFRLKQPAETALPQDELTKSPVRTVPSDVPDQRAKNHAESPVASLIKVAASPDSASRLRADPYAPPAGAVAPPRSPRLIMNSRPPRQSDGQDFYPLDRVWFLGWVDAQWTDIHDRFSARQYADSVVIQYLGEDGDNFGQRRMVFHEEDPAKTKMVVRFRLERGSISFAFQPHNLSTLGEMVDQGITVGDTYTVESWLDAATRQGITRITGATQSSAVARDVPLGAYFACSLSATSLLRIYDLNFVRQTEADAPIAAAPNTSLAGASAAGAERIAAMDAHQSSMPDDGRKSEAAVDAKHAAALEDIRRSIDARIADIARLEAKRSEAESEIKLIEQKLASLYKTLNKARRAQDAQRTLSEIDTAKSDLKKARARVRRLQSEIEANQRLNETARARLENDVGEAKSAATKFDNSDFFEDD